MRSCRRDVLCATVLTLAVAGCSGGGGGDNGPVTSTPELGQYAGTVVDGDGDPIPGAHVSIDGIESTTVTDASGKFFVNDPSLATESGAEASSFHAARAVATRSISVVAPGYDPIELPLDVASGERFNVELLESSLDPTLTVTAPESGKLHSVSASCATPSVLVEGYARLANTASYQLDLVVVLDRSGSTSRDAFDVDQDGQIDSVLEAEIEATHCLLSNLDPSATRVAIVQFNDNADIVQGFSSDKDDWLAALGNLGTPFGGTNYEAALGVARGLFEDLALSDAASEVASEDPAPEIPHPYRTVLFLSDGIPTSHGIPRNTSDSNLTQSSADREAAVTAAEALGSVEAQLFAFSIIPASDTNRPRTTLPHCVAVCGGGHYENISQIDQLRDAICGKPLASLLSVDIKNLTLDTDPIDVSLLPDGFFSALVPVSSNGDVDEHGNVIHRIDVTLRAFSGDIERVLSETLEVRVISSDVLPTLTNEEIAELQSDSVTVSQRSHLTDPQGKRIRSSELHDFLTGDYEDGVEVHGLDGISGNSFEVEFVFKEACYSSDVGYFTFPAESPPASAAEALLSLSATNVFTNTKDLGSGPGCDRDEIAPGESVFNVTPPSGHAVAFFIVPNRSLAQYQTNPAHPLQPLFTLRSLNPGGFDQALSFVSARGRTASGASEVVVTPGPLAIFAFEDLSLVKGSNHDFADIIFSVKSLTPEIDEAVCP